MKNHETMPAGRELDAEIHRKVMGRQCDFVASEPHQSGPDPDSPLGFSTNFGGAVFTADRDWLVDDWYDPDANREVPYYSTDIAAAWQVAERITNAFGLKIVMLPDAAEVHWTTAPPASPRWREAVGSGETLPLALCRCALLAKLTEAPCPDPSPR